MWEKIKIDYIRNDLKKKNYNSDLRTAIQAEWNRICGKKNSHEKKSRKQPVFPEKLSYQTDFLYFNGFEFKVLQSEYASESGLIIGKTIYLWDKIIIGDIDNPENLFLEKELNLKKLEEERDALYSEISEKREFFRKNIIAEKENQHRLEIEELWGLFNTEIEACLKIDEAREIYQVESRKLKNEKKELFQKLLNQK